MNNLLPSSQYLPVQLHFCNGISKICLRVKRADFEERLDIFLSVGVSSTLPPAPRRGRRTPGTQSHPQGDPGNHRQDSRRGRERHHQKRLEVRGDGPGPTLSHHLHNVHNHCDYCSAVLSASHNCDISWHCILLELYRRPDCNAEHWCRLPNRIEAWELIIQLQIMYDPNQKKAPLKSGSSGCSFTAAVSRKGLKPGSWARSIYCPGPQYKVNSILTTKSPSPSISLFGIQNMHYLSFFLHWTPITIWNVLYHTIRIDIKSYTDYCTSTTFHSTLWFSLRFLFILGSLCTWNRVILAWNLSREVAPGHVGVVYIEQVHLCSHGVEWGHLGVMWSRNAERRRKRDNSSVRQFIRKNLRQFIWRQFIRGTINPNLISFPMDMRACRGLPPCAVHSILT